jgi:hypothetical protein
VFSSSSAESYLGEKRNFPTLKYLENKRRSCNKMWLYKTFHILRNKISDHFVDDFRLIKRNVFFIIFLEINLPTPVPRIKSQINYCLSVNDDSFLAKKTQRLDL